MLRALVGTPYKKRNAKNSVVFCTGKLVLFAFGFSPIVVLPGEVLLLGEHTIVTDIMVK